jgi:hypothetical protein
LSIERKTPIFRACENHSQNKKGRKLDKERYQLLVMKREIKEENQMSSKTSLGDGGEVATSAPNREI